MIKGSDFSVEKDVIKIEINGLKAISNDDGEISVFSRTGELLYYHDSILSIVEFMKDYVEDEDDDDSCYNDLDDLESDLD